MTIDETPGFNTRLWFRFINIARPYWLSPERGFAWGMFALLIVLLLGQTAFSVLFNRETGEFTSALAAGAFAAILSALTVIVQNSEGLSRFSAGVDRLHAFSQALEEEGANATAVDSKIQTEHGAALALKDVTVFTPNREQLLLKELTLTVVLVRV